MEILIVFCVLYATLMNALCQFSRVWFDRELENWKRASKTRNLNSDEKLLYDMLCMHQIKNIRLTHRDKRMYRVYLFTNYPNIYTIAYSMCWTIFALPLAYYWGLVVTIVYVLANAGLVWYMVVNTAKSNLTNS